MCGIFGYIGKELPLEKLNACTSSLAHRGPDEGGTWSTDGVFLSHRRLSILDLSEKGRQPMSYKNRYHITFNGEIYNYLEIRAQLQGLGHSFVSDSDTEVLLAAYDQWGPDCLHKFNGMWACAIWDRARQELFVSRDRLGKKPFFFAFLKDGSLAFASEMKGLIPLLDKVIPNEELFSGYSMFTYESSSKTLIKGIERFPAGSYGFYKKGDASISISSYWNTLDHLVGVPASYEEQCAAFREFFFDSVRLRMRADVPIGTLLSGGLDSSAVIAALSHIGADRPASQWQHAFVASFPGSPIDESEYARTVADHLHVPATFLTIKPEAATDHLLDFMWFFEDLYLTNPIPFILTYRRVKEEGISVTLDGHGSDELFGGYGSDVLVALRDAFPRPASMHEIRDTYQEMQSFGSGFAKASLRSMTEGMARYLVDPLFRNALKPYAAHPHWKQMDHLTRRLFVDTHITILPTLLRNYDRYSMASGVEVRMPFLDHRLVSFAFSLPWMAKVRGGFSKAIVRDAMRDFLPREIIERKKKIGFNAPFIEWLQGPLKSYVSDILSSSDFMNASLIDPQQTSARIRAIMHNPRATFADGERAWRMLMPFLWEEVFVKGKRSI